jgi:hypothetical protein
MKLSKLVLIGCLVAGLTSCLPVVVANIAIGTGKSLADMDTVEKIIQARHFVRIWYEPKDKEKTPRVDKINRYESGFETRNPRGFGASVVLMKETGQLFILFSERNDRFSEAGLKLLDTLKDDAEQEFGDGVVVSKP